MATREDASACGLCTPGSSSKAVLDDTGRTYTCNLDSCGTRSVKQSASNFKNACVLFFPICHMRGSRFYQRSSFSFSSSSLLRAPDPSAHCRAQHMYTHVRYARTSAGKNAAKLVLFQFVQFQKVQFVVGV